MPPGCLLPGVVNLRHQWLTEPEDVYRHLAQVAPIRHFRSLVPDSHFYQWAGLLNLGNTILASYCSSNVSFRIEDVAVVHLVTCFAGYRRVTTPMGEVHTTTGGLMLLPVGERDAWGSHSAAVVSLQPARIAHTAMVMAARDSGSMPTLASFAVFAPLLCPDGPQVRLAHSLVQSIDAAAAVHPRLPTLLGYDDSLHRLAATLLQPALLHEEPADLPRYRERDGRRSFDELLDYIEANLDQPLRLSDLEARSFYSSRALQYAFRERLGCTPKQWIRQQRLKRAMEQLQQLDGSTTIRDIAWSCGYRQMSLFGSDFKRQFGCSPSQARRGWGP